MECRVKLQRDSDGQFVCIPFELELPSEEVTIRKVGDQLIIESRKDNSTVAATDQAVD